MKKAEDITVKSKEINAKAKAIQLIPATTPAIIAHYRQYLQLIGAQFSKIYAPSATFNQP